MGFYPFLCQHIQGYIITVSFQCKHFFVFRQFRLLCFPCGFTCCLLTDSHAVSLRIRMLFPCGFSCCFLTDSSAVSLRIHLLFHYGINCCFPADSHVVSLRIQLLFICCLLGISLPCDIFSSFSFLLVPSMI